MIKNNLKNIKVTEAIYEEILKNQSNKKFMKTY